MIFKKILFFIDILLLRLFLKREDIIEKMETILVKSFIDNINFEMIKDLSDKELEAFTLYFCLYFTEPYSFHKSIREEVIILSHKKCLRKAKWKIALLQ